MNGKRAQTKHSNRQSKRRAAIWTACGVAAAGTTVLSGRLWAASDAGGTSKTNVVKPAADNRPLSEDEKIVHVLNRLGFGPRPGDVARIKAMGLDRYIDLQLHPERIDDSKVDGKIAQLASLNLSGDALAEMYREQAEAFREAQKLRKEAVSDGIQKEKAEGKLGADGQPTMAADGAAAATAGGDDKGKGKKDALAEATPQERQEMMQARMAVMEKYRPVRQAQMQFLTAKMVRATESERQLQEVLVDFWSNHFNIDMRKNLCGTLKIADDRDVIRKYALGKFRDLLGASAHSPAMLVYLDNFQSTTPGGAGMPAQAQQRLQRAKRMAANNPQMQARIAEIEKQLAQRQQKGAAQRGGINENYAREIMELHTLGVDGGYTQKDVQEVARCFTGWGLSRGPNGDNRVMAAPAGKNGLRQIGGDFQFHPYLHDNGEKTVLGHTIPANGGIQDGETVLDILASAPQTQRHISYQLCQRLVSDTPPESLIKKCVATWQKTDGDIREIVRTIVTSPEFYARSTFRAKIKSPFEYAVSSVRALGGTYDTFTPEGQARVRGKAIKNGVSFQNLGQNTLAGQVDTMGQPLFQYQAPTGYPEDSHKWVSSGALISRLNFSLALTAGRLIDISVPTAGDAMVPTAAVSAVKPDQVVDHLAGQILLTDVSPATRATLVKEAGSDLGTDAVAVGEDTQTTRRLTALLLGSPEFQRR